MRNAFAKAMEEITASQDDVLLLSGDIGNRMFDKLKEKTHQQFINCGIAEQTMIGTAAGLALSGLRPVVYTIAPFTTYRCFEQIRVDICYNKAPVVIVGTGAGLSYASLGPTHHSLEDIAILRSLPGMTVLCPSGPAETVEALNSALSRQTPCYIRLGKKGELDLYEGSNTFEIGKSITLREGQDACLIGAGPILSQAMQAAEVLAKDGITIRVENFHSVKPIDTKRLDELADSFPQVFILEEHGRIGGLFGAIAEWYSTKENKTPVLQPISSDDRFLHHIGDYNFALANFGLDTDNIVQTVLNKVG